MLLSLSPPRLHSNPHSPSLYTIAMSLASHTHSLTHCSFLLALIPAITPDRIVPFLFCYLMRGKITHSFSHVWNCLSRLILQPTCQICLQITTRVFLHTVSYLFIFSLPLIVLHPPPTPLTLMNL